MQQARLGERLARGRNPTRCRRAEHRRRHLRVGDELLGDLLCLAGPLLDGVLLPSSWTFSLSFGTSDSRVLRPRELLVADGTAAAGERCQQRKLDRPAAVDRLKVLGRRRPRSAVDASTAATIATRAATSPPRLFIRILLLVDSRVDLDVGIATSVAVSDGRPQRPDARGRDLHSRRRRTDMSTFRRVRVTARRAAKCAAQPGTVTAVVEGNRPSPHLPHETGLFSDGRSRSRPCAASASRSARVSCSGSWVPTAPARPRRSRC